MASTQPFGTATKSVKAVTGRISFLEFPDNVRRKIYNEFFDIAGFQDNVSWEYQMIAPRQRGLDNLRAPNWKKTCYAVRLVCNQIREEALNVQCGNRGLEGIVDFHDGLFGSRKYWTISHDSQTRCILSKLNHIRALDLLLCVSEDHNNLCRVQDSLFDLFDHLSDHPHLHQLNVRVALKLKHPRRFLGQRVGKMQPGQISRVHYAAFLTDPIRGVRLVGNGKEAGKFSLDFRGIDYKPGGQISRQVQAIVRSDSRPLDYKVFHRYGLVLHELEFLVADQVGIDLHEEDLRAIKSDLEESRIRGDITTFHKNHGEYVDAVTERIRTSVDDCRKWNFYSFEEWRLGLELQIREQLGELCEALPTEDADTSFLGYAIVDEMLREWQTLTTKEEPKAWLGSKREREREEACVERSIKKSSLGYREYKEDEDEDEDDEENSDFVVDDESMHDFVECEMETD